MYERINKTKKDSSEEAINAISEWPCWTGSTVEICIDFSSPYASAQSSSRIL